MQPGNYLQDRHCVVTFELTRIVSVELTEPIFPAIIFGLALAQDRSGWTITWDSSYGAAGEFTAQTVRIGLEPGLPTDREEAKK